MRNSSLVEEFCADNPRDYKHSTEAMDSTVYCRVVEERSANRRRHTERIAGGRRNDYPGTSSDKPGEIPGHRKPKVS